MLSLKPSCLERREEKRSSLRVPSSHRAVPVPLPAGHRVPASLPRVLGPSVLWTLFPLRSFCRSLRTRNLTSLFLSLGVDSLHWEKASAIVVRACCNSPLCSPEVPQKSFEQLGRGQHLVTFRLRTSLQLLLPCFIRPQLP